MIRLGEVDLKKSEVQIFPAVASDTGVWYYFYVQLKDRNGNYVDCGPHELTLATTKGQPIPFDYERRLPGRYYLTVEKSADFSSSQLNFFVQNKPLKEKFKLHFSPPSRSKSKISVLEKNSRYLKLQLKLIDEQNRPVQMPDKPEVMFEGHGYIEDIKQVEEGTWEFRVIYPDENQIMYFSVRAMGVFMPKIFRYHHVQDW